LTPNDEDIKSAEFCFEGGLISFVEFLNKSKELMYSFKLGLFL
jgi:DNA gyrase/topoisomerase IV subunit B